MDQRCPQCRATPEQQRRHEAEDALLVELARLVVEELRAPTRLNRERMFEVLRHFDALHDEAVQEEEAIRALRAMEAELARD